MNELNQSNFTVVSGFIIAIITLGIVPLVKVIGQVIKDSAPARAERKALRLQKKEDKKKLKNS